MPSDDPAGPGDAAADGEEGPLPRRARRCPESIRRRRTSSSSTPRRTGSPAELALAPHRDVEFGRFVEIIDAETLEAPAAGRVELSTRAPLPRPDQDPAGDRARRRRPSPTASSSPSSTDLEEAEIVFDVLERGSDGVLLAPANAGDVSALARPLEAGTPELELTTLTVDGIRAPRPRRPGLRGHLLALRRGRGHPRRLVLHGLHPLLSARPTRCRTCRPGRSGSTPAPCTRTRSARTTAPTTSASCGRAARSLAVDADGRTRRVIVGRVKIESRPLLTIDAARPTARLVSLIVQDDWHVRVLGPGGRSSTSPNCSPATSCSATWRPSSAMWASRSTSSAGRADERRHRYGDPRRRRLFDAHAAAICRISTRRRIRSPAASYARAAATEAAVFAGYGIGRAARCCCGFRRASPRSRCCSRCGGWAPR